MAFQNEVTFDIHVVGDKTGETWTGTFKSKKWLAHGDNVRRDALRRELLGVNPQFAEDRALSQAEVISDLAVYVIDGPKWYLESGSGAKLHDDNLMTDIHTQVLKIANGAADEQKKRATEAAVMLKAQATATAQQ